MTREPDRFRHDDSFRESHASDGTAFGHVGQPSTPIDDEIERGAKWEMLALRYIEGVPDIVRLINEFVAARTNHTRLAGMGKLSFAGIDAQSKYAAARSALDKMAEEREA
jgi:hypothetical protein